MCPDLVIVTEHGQSSGDIVNTVLSGYTLVSAFCRQNVIKGGVAIFKKSNIENDIKSLNIEEMSAPLTCEVSAVSVTLNDKTHLRILGIYRPPKSDKESFDTAMRTLSSILDMWIIQHNPIIVMGDFNIDSLVPSCERKQLMELLAAYDIQRLDLPATRITNRSRTSIDMFCISVQYTESVNIKVINTGISDHTGQLCNLSTNIARVSSVFTTGRSINNDSLEVLRAHLSDITWMDVLECSDVEDAYNRFLMNINLALNAACPIKRKRQRPDKAFKHVFDDEARLLKEQFLNAQDSYILTGSEDDRRRAATLKKQYDLKLQTLRKEACSNYIVNSDNKSKSIWKVINCERRNKTDSTDIKQLKIGNSSVTDPTTITNLFNNFFSSIADETLRENLGKVKQGKRSKRWAVDVYTSLLIPTNGKELLGIISSMKSKTSAGVDEFSSVMVKYCCNELVVPLVYIVNLSLSQGKVPSKMKCSKVIPLHKKGSRYLMGNYRPITVVSTFSKLIEKVVQVRVLNHLNLNEIKLEGQHGFTRNKSTTTALVDLVEQLTDKLEIGEGVVGFFLDLTKAFDCLDHSMIITKLSNIGFGDTALSWFASYLSGRSQMVELSQTMKGVRTSYRSHPLPVERGVPQGSVLGPLLFILFVSDLPDYISPFGTTVSYADDTVLVISNKDKEELEVQSFIALSLATEYCTVNDLVVNESKTKQLVLGRFRDEVSTFPNLEHANVVNHLGVFIDSKLSWRDHIDQLCCKLSSALFVLRRIKQVGTEEAVRTAYNSLFESHLRYGIVLWGASSRSDLERVLIIQKRAIRIMANLDWRDSCRDTYRQAGILTVIGVYLLEVIHLASSSQLLRNTDLHTYPTRNAQDFALPVHHSRRYQSKPAYAGSKYFNILPDEIKRSDPAKLKKKLQIWLTQYPFYSIAEFLDWQHFSA